MKLAWGHGREPTPRELLIGAAGFAVAALVVFLFILTAGGAR